MPIWTQQVWGALGLACLTSTQVRLMVLSSEPHGWAPRPALPWPILYPCLPSACPLWPAVLLACLENSFSRLPLVKTLLPQ